MRCNINLYRRDDNMQTLSNFKYKIWDSVQSPIGIVQLITGNQQFNNQYDELAQFLNFNRYIVAQKNHTDNSPEHAIRFGRYISQTFEQPLFFISDDCDNAIVQHMIQQNNLYAGAISVAHHPQCTKTSIWDRLFPKQHNTISDHIPLMIISGHIKASRSWEKLGRILHQMYGVYDADKLTVVMYPEINADKILTCNNNIKHDILEFLDENQNKK